MLSLTSVIPVLHQIILQCMNSMVVVIFRVFSYYVSCEALELVVAVKPEFSLGNYPVTYSPWLLRKSWAFGRAVRTDHPP